MLLLCACLLLFGYYAAASVKVPTEASVKYFYTMCIEDWCVSFLIPLDVGSDSNPFANSYHIDHFAYADWAVTLNVG